MYAFVVNVGLLDRLICCQCWLAYQMNLLSMLVCLTNEFVVNVGLLDR